MRALVTGGLGFLGSHLTRRLIDEGWDVVVLDNASNAADWTSVVEGAHIVRQSIDEWEPNIDAPEVIFHLASPVGPIGVLRHRGNVANRIIVDADIVACWAERWGATLVDVSTSEIYGWREDAVCIESSNRVVGPGHSGRMEYTVGKLAAETMLLNRSDLNLRIVRPFNIAGPRQSDWGGFVIPTFIRQALAGEPLTVHEPGSQRRAFTHVSDVVSGMLLALSRGENHGYWNLGNPSNVGTILELAHEVIDLIGSKSTIQIVDPARLFDGYVQAAEKIPNIDKAVTELGWAPVIGRAQILRDSLAWELG